MKHQKSITLLFSIGLVALVSLNINLAGAGWDTDPVGDVSQTYFDITKLTISKASLQITMNENPYYNDSGTTNWRFYNIWIDTSMHDTNPDTETWSTDVYEYIAHFDCRWNGEQWINNSYINAFRYYLTSDGSDEVEGSFYWDGNNWGASDPNIDVAVISGTTITFDIDGAIHREQPLGTGYVIQGVANTSNGTTVDTAPNYGWVDEFDNNCPSPPDNNTTEETPFSGIGLLFSITILGIIGSNLYIKRRNRR